MKKIFILIMLTLFIVSCAADDGDKVECPECDNETTVLVGTQCVPIEQIEMCGPDGHAHGEECHCFSGQEVTVINGEQYCLQADCTSETVECSGHGDLEDGVCHCDEGFEQDHDDATKCVIEDIDQHACEHIDNIEEHVDAVDQFENFSNAHADLGIGIEVHIPQGVSYLHFPNDETSTMGIFISKPSLLKSVTNSSQEEFTLENLGANSDCSDKIGEVFHVDLVNDSGSRVPAIIKFETDVENGENINLFLHLVEHDHE